MAGIGAFVWNLPHYFFIYTSFRYWSRHLHKAHNIFGAGKISVKDIHECSFQTVFPGRVTEIFPVNFPSRLRTNVFVFLLLHIKNETKFAQPRDLYLRTYLHHANPPFYLISAYFYNPGIPAATLPFRSRGPGRLGNRTPPKCLHTNLTFLVHFDFIFYKYFGIWWDCSSLKVILMTQYTFNFAGELSATAIKFYMVLLYDVGRIGRKLVILGDIKTESKLLCDTFI